MAHTTQATIFISFSWKDGATIAKRFASSLRAQGFEVWFDEDRLKPGARWRHEIEKVLDNAQIVLAVVTPGSLDSDICRAEQLRSLRNGNLIIPILASGHPRDLPPHLAEFQCLDFTRRDSFATRLRELMKLLREVPRHRVPSDRFATTEVTVPPLPRHYVHRNEAVRSLRRLLIRDDPGEGMALVAVTGAAGIGKTVTALALCHDEVVRQAYPDGIIWMNAQSPNPDPSERFSRLQEVRAALGDTPDPAESAARCLNRYRSLMRHKAVLIVADDVNREEEVQSLFADSPGSALVFTSRHRSLGVAVRSAEFAVNRMTDTQAIELLTRSAGVAPVEAGEALQLIKTCQGLPLVISLLGSSLRDTPTEQWPRVANVISDSASQLLEAGIAGQSYTDLLRILRGRMEDASSDSPSQAFFPEDLVRALASGRCVLYAGAGLSNYAKFPVWRTLARQLVERAKDLGTLPEDVVNLLGDSLTEGKVDHVVDELVESMPPKLLINELRRIFLRDAPLPEAHALLRQLPFSSILTTNFDELLERTFKPEGVYTPADCQLLIQAQNRGEQYVLKLYGTLDRPETVFVGPLQFEAAMGENLPFSQFVEGLFVSRTVFFVGCSLEGIEAYLRAIRFRGGHSGAHYALSGVLGTSWKPMASALERRYGIRVIPYRANDGIDLLHSLHELQQLVGKHTPIAEPPSGSRLRQVILKDIGPFTELDLELNEDCNVFLGNNGAGKSTILRAIAAAICGEEARPYAQRLMRAGSLTSSITLKFDKSKYEMVLQRGQSGVLVSVSPSRPLEAEGSLVLGFPALRSAFGGPSAGPAREGDMIPTSGDILPLVAGDTDTCIGRLSQWLVNLDYRAKDERSRTGASSRYDGLIATFFEIVSDLTEGQSIRFGRVDPASKQVMVLTENGEVPLEYLSQGTASLLSWIGILLQRLYDIHGHDSNPKGKRALVLIDEIDAHMHPYWQQILLGKVREYFPHIQLIATTHSPLIVSGLDSSKAFVVDRGAVRNYDMKLEGLDADKILTSPLFGLSDSRDVSTQKKHQRYSQLRRAQTLSDKEEAERLSLAKELFGPNGPNIEAVSSRLAKSLISHKTPANQAERSRLVKEIELFVQETLAGKRSS